MTRKPSTKQYKNWIKHRLKQMQSSKLTDEQREYYNNKVLGKLTTQPFEDIIKTNSKGELILSRKQKNIEKALEHAWNILRKVSTPSKLSQRTIKREKEKQMMSDTMDYLYTNFTESEIKTILPDRDEKGQFSKEDYNNLLHLRENKSTQEIQEDIDINESFFI